MNLEIIAFSLITFGALLFAFKRYKAIYRAICLGHSIRPVSDKITRWKNVIYFALGQRKMFSRPVAGIFHLFIYLAFIITQVEAIEILMDGFLGTHRFFAGTLGSFYTFVINFIEILSVLALIATLVFLSRRNLLKLPRFSKADLQGWPFRDANLILIGEIILIVSIFMMNGSYLILQDVRPMEYPHAGNFYFSSHSTQLFLANISIETNIFLERFFWWSHYLVVLGFLVYLPYSKHLHILLTFPNSYYSDLNPRGQMENIPAIENEVRNMLGMEPKEISANAEEFGAADVHDLPWTTLLQAFSCTECGRCTSVCPANQTGKKLSPRKIIMNIRDRAEEVIQNQSAAFNTESKRFEITDGKSLSDLITAEEIYACTSCNACVEACPVLINPLTPILELRRHDVLMKSAGPQEWLALFNSLENKQAAWSMSESRTSWTQN